MLFRPPLYAGVMFSLHLTKKSLRIPIHEGDNLTAGAGGCGAEVIAAGAGGDVLGHSPRHSVGVVDVRSHIAEVAAGDGGRAIGPPQEGDGLAAGQHCIGANVVAVVPVVMPSETAQRIASA